MDPDGHRSLKGFQDVPAVSGEGGGGVAPGTPAPKAARADKAAEVNADLLAEEGRNLKARHPLRGEASGRSGPPQATLQVIPRGQGAREAKKKQAVAQAPRKPRARPAKATAKAVPRTKPRVAQKDEAPAADQGVVGGIVGGSVLGTAAQGPAAPAAPPPPAPSSAPAAKADWAAVASARPPPATGGVAVADAERAPAHHRARHAARRQARAPAAEHTRAASAPQRYAASSGSAGRPADLERAVHLLDAGEARRALPLLDALLARPEAGWTPQAYYERCRARIALGRRADAEADCRRVVSAGGPFAARARHLLLVLESSQ